MSGDRAQGAIELKVQEPRETPVMSLVLGYGAMVPFVVGLAALALAGGVLRDVVIELMLLWGAAILTFLSGVRRGVSFRTPEGPTRNQITMMLWLFGLGILALVALGMDLPAVATALQLAGYASLGALDPMAARRGETPLFFARLRPWQMAIPVVCLTVIGAVITWA